MSRECGHQSPGQQYLPLGECPLCDWDFALEVGDVARKNWRHRRAPLVQWMRENGLAGWPEATDHCETVSREPVRATKEGLMPTQLQVLAVLQSEFGVRGAEKAIGLLSALGIEFDAQEEILNRSRGSA